MTAAKRPPATHRSLTARGAATRARIISAAAELIYAHGVDRTSLDDVMAASGASKSQLYHYFADKDALVLEVIAYQTQRVLAAQGTQLEALDSLSALEAWRDAILQLNEATGWMGCPLGSLASELANDSRPARLTLSNSFATWRDRVEQGLMRMHERGELASSADPHALALALLTAVQGGLILSKTSRSNQPLEIALDMAINHVAKHTTVP
ncbi:MAG: TetR/AcrR family transcriptional regulator [Thiomonas sp.]|nr:TetR/AcrR family transcriptional regulator [Thiomonas sp.]